MSYTNSLSSLLLSFLLLLLFVDENVGLFSGFRSKQTSVSTSNRKEASDSSAIPKKRRFVPQVRPHPDTKYLLELVTDDTNPTLFMEPIVNRLEDELETKVRKINIQRRPDFLLLFEALGGNEGGQFPFFYNRRTRKAICGTTYYQNLLSLACGFPSVDFSGSFVEFDRMTGMRSTGFRDTLNEMMYKRSGKSKSTGQSSRDKQDVEEVDANEQDR
jgi:hypothetical protein